MGKFIHNTLCGVSALALTAVPALAQDSAANGAAAQDADQAGIGEIVVTATKREQNLQDTPIAISAFSEESLEASRIEGIGDLDVTTPSLAISTNGLGQALFLRGVGSADASPGQEAPVAIYLDNVYQPTTQSNNIPFSNIERVEVLKGPQGTLFGRNATGGLVHVITKEPTEELSGDFSVGYGNYESVTAKGYIAGGLTDWLRADIAGYYFNRAKGWGVNLFTGNETYKNDMVALRSKWVAEPASALKITLIGDYLKQKTSTTYNYRIVPGTKPLTFPGQTLYGPTPRHHDINSIVDPYTEIEQWSASGRIEYDLGFATVTSQTSYQDVTISPNRQAPGATPEALVVADFVKSKNDTFQQELQLASNSSGPLRWITGLYYMDMTGGSGGPAGIKLSGAAVLGGIPIPGIGSVNIIGLVDTKSYAAFAEVGYDLTEKLSITVGGRYTIDRRKFYGSTELDFSQFGYKPIPGTYAAFGPTKVEYKQPSYRAIVDYDVNDDVMLYASYSRGFKSGNFNTVNPANPPYEPETLDAFEAGFKSRLLDNTLQFNASAFYYKYANLQLQVNVGPTLVTVNAAKAEVKGAEADITFQPIDNFRFQLGYSYLDAKYQDFPGAVCQFPNPVAPTATTPGYGNIQGNCLTDFGENISGRPLTRVPEHQFNITSNYTVPTSAGDFDFNATLLTNSGFTWVPSGRLSQPAYEIVNGSIRWTSVDENVYASLWGKNLFDTEYVAFATEQGFADIQVAAAPRTFGFEIGYKF